MYTKQYTSHFELDEPLLWLEYPSIRACLAVSMVSIPLMLLTSHQLQ